MLLIILSFNYFVCFIFFLANKANAQITFSGFGYPAANGVPTDSGLVKLINPSNDTITKKIGRFMENFYMKTSDAGWINIDDTCKIIISDTTGQTANTFWITKSVGNYVHTLFPDGHAFLVKDVANSVDSVDAKCYSIGPSVWSDTLEGRFRIGIPHDDIYFNREEFLNPPALNDSFVIEVSEGSLYARTAGKYERALWDAETEQRTVFSVNHAVQSQSTARVTFIYLSVEQNLYGIKSFMVMMRIKVKVQFLNLFIIFQRIVQSIKLPSQLHM